MDLEPVPSAYARREILRAGLRAVGIVVAYFVLPFAHNWFVAALLLGFVLFGLFPFAVTAVPPGAPLGAPGRRRRQRAC